MITPPCSERRADAEFRPQSQKSTDCHSVLSETLADHLQTHAYGCMLIVISNLENRNKRYCDNLELLRLQLFKTAQNLIQYDARDKFPSRVVGGGMAGESVAT